LIISLPQYLKIVSNFNDNRQCKFSTTTNFEENDIIGINLAKTYFFLEEINLAKA